MGLFSFFTENGKGCLAMLAKGTLIFEVTPLASVKSVLMTTQYGLVSVYVGGLLR